jgi:hypothetical protein
MHGLANSTTITHGCCVGSSGLRALLMKRTATSAFSDFTAALCLSWYYVDDHGPTRVNDVALSSTHDRNSKLGYFQKKDFSKSGIIMSERDEIMTTMIAWVIRADGNNRKVLHEAVFPDLHISS